MIWDKWIPDKYLVKPEVCALKFRYTDEKQVIYFTHLKKKNNKLEIVATGSVDDLQQLPVNILKNKIPLLVIVNGKGVILKKIMTPSPNIDLPEIIRQNLPTINVSEFYIQLYQQNDGSGFLTLCRKEQVDLILGSFLKQKIEPANLYIGAPVIIGLQPLWVNYNSVPSSLFTAEITNGNLDRLVNLNNANNEPVELEGLQFTSNYTLGFAAGLSYLMKRKIVESNSDAINKLENNHIEKNKIRLIAQVVVSIAFIISIANALVYTSFFDKSNKLETELSVHQGKYEQINELLSDYQKNKELIENAGVLNRNKLSEYADQIAKTLPDGVVLSELSFNPIEDDTESVDSLISFQNNIIVLKGHCQKSFVVNEWLNVLNMQKFIVDVSMDKFVYNNESMLPNFQIKVLTK